MSKEVANVAIIIKTKHPTLIQQANKELGVAGGQIKLTLVEISSSLAKVSEVTILMKKIVD